MATPPHSKQLRMLPDHETERMQCMYEHLSNTCMAIPICKLPTVCLAGKLVMHGQQGRCNKMRTAIARRGSCSSGGRIVLGGSRRGSRRTPSCRTPSCRCKKRRLVYRKQHACPVTHESLQRSDNVDQCIVQF